MVLLDVNTLVYAQREDMPAHALMRDWLERSLEGPEPVGIFEPTLASFVRIVTNRRIFKTPSPLDVTFAFVEAVRTAPAARLLALPAYHWRTFERLCREIGASGDDVPDAYLAAIAIELDAEFVSTDRGFARFQGLKWRQPF